MKSWLVEVQHINVIQIPRALTLKETITEQELHAFSDASLDAYGVAVYLRTSYSTSQEVTVRLVIAKSRVTPLRSISMPRLELMAAGLGTKLVPSIQDVLEVSKEKTYHWTDSTDVLHWVKNVSRKYKSFVANRVGDIHEASIPSNWKYISTAINPADVVSRGQSAEHLSVNHIWWEGPEFLKTEKSGWPNKELPVKENDEEVRSKFELSFHIRMLPTEETTEKGLAELHLHPKQFSSLFRLHLVMSMVLRWIANLKNKKINRISGMITLKELTETKQLYQRWSQQNWYKKEVELLHTGKEISKNSKLISMNPWLDNQGVMRASSRLSEADQLSWKLRFPVLLSKECAYTKLLVRELHQRELHAGPSFIYNQLVKEYWIPAARDLVKHVQQNCNYCKLRISRPAQPEMAPLPVLRTQISVKPFENCSLDYAGPFYTKQGRGRSQLKRYLCLFVCMASRAVHFEMAYDLSTDGFLRALIRMTNRRGNPTTILSDNGTNFVGAAKELSELISGWNKNLLNQEMLKRGIEWSFNPPLAPHFNGVHEIMVRSAKKILMKLFNKADITDEELMTAFIMAENQLNMRPLTYQTSNLGDPLPITPNDFLQGRLGEDVYIEAAENSKYNIQKRWRHLQHLASMFWRRWRQEWLPKLRDRQKWSRKHANLSIGDIVLVIEESTPQNTYPLGHIIQVFPGKDGVVRVVEVKIGTRVLRRSAAKLCFFEAEV